MKRMRHSKTMWFSLALVIFGALEAGFPYLQNIIDQRFYGVILVTIGVIVAVLRFITTGPIR